MRPKSLQRIVIHQFALATLLTAAGPLLAAEPPTSSTIRIKLNCVKDSAHVWVFDANGLKVDENDIRPGDKKEADIQERGNRHFTAANRFLTTSATEGCVQAQPGRDAGRRAINVLDMTCIQSQPIDLVLSAGPEVTFAVHGTVPKVLKGPKVESDAPCQWDQTDLADSTVYYFTFGQELLLVVNANGKKARMPLDWRKARAATTPMSLDKVCSTKHGPCALNQVDLQVPLNRIMVQTRPSK